MGNSRARHSLVECPGPNCVRPARGTGEALPCAVPSASGAQGSRNEGRYRFVMFNAVGVPFSRCPARSRLVVR